MTGIAILIVLIGIVLFAVGANGLSEGGATPRQRLNSAIVILFGFILVILAGVQLGMAR